MRSSGAVVRPAADTKHLCNCPIGAPRSQMIRGEVTCLQHRASSLWAADEEPDQGHFSKGLIGQWHPSSFVKSGPSEFSIDSLESIEFVIFIPSITNYHSEGPPEPSGYPRVEMSSFSRETSHLPVNKGTSSS